MSDPEDNPWTTLRSQIGYENPWIQVIHNEVLTPAGDPGVYGVVHFRNIAVGAVPIDADGATYLVGQFRYPLGRYSWEIPEGGSSSGDPLADAQRELREETGLVAASWQQILRLDLSNSVTDEQALVWLAYGLTPGTAQPDADERLEIRRLPFAQAVEMALAGEITDAISVAALLRVRLMAATGALPAPLKAVLGPGA